MKARRKYRIFVCCLLAVSLLGLGVAFWAAVRNQIPDQLLVREAGELPELFSYPLSALVTEEAVGQRGGGAEEGGQNVSLDSQAAEESGRGAGGTAEGGRDVPLDSQAAEESGGGTGRTAGRGQNVPLDSQAVEESGGGTGGTAEGGRDRAGNPPPVDSAGEQDGTVNAVDQGSVLQAGKAPGTETSVQPDGAAAPAQASGYEISYRLFGKIPLKTVSASVVEPMTLYAGGMPIGIYLETDGVLVVDIGSIRCEDGEECCPAENIVKSGDYILAADGQELSTKEELVACISRCGGEDVVLEVERAGERLKLKVQPVKDETGTYRAGIWVRNDTQGIGTLTYVDKEGRFGTLGHGISDVDTGDLLEITRGDLYNADVISIVKGRQGTPGELSGVIHYSEGYKIGIIEENCPNGIYGTISGFPLLAEHLTEYEVAYRQSVQPGPASILCSVDGTLREYGVEIEEVRLNGKDINKGMVLKVTDPELLALTGGIVQGMSGSPILQNGKLVGAVTHVFVNDAAKGYGIFIENMIKH